MQKSDFIIEVNEGDAIIVEDFLEGEFIDVYCQRVSLQRKTDVFRELCQVVQEMHNKGVFHLDLKPENVLVDKAGVVHVVDFGSAQVANQI